VKGLRLLGRLVPLLRAVGLGGAADRLAARAVRASGAVDLSRYAASEALLLLPRCLQRSGCDADLLSNPENCKRCGQCSVGGILALRSGGLKVAVVGGGEAAVAAVSGSGARIVVAVACERELVEGALRCRGAAVLGIPNERPEGPCRNTTVDLARVAAAVSMLRES